MLQSDVGSMSCANSSKADSSQRLVEELRAKETQNARRSALLQQIMHSWLQNLPTISTMSSACKSSTVTAGSYVEHGTSTAKLLSSAEARWRPPSTHPARTDDSSSLAALLPHSSRASRDPKLGTSQTPNTCQGGTCFSMSRKVLGSLIGTPRRSQTDAPALPIDSTGGDCRLVPSAAVLHETHKLGHQNSCCHRQPPASLTIIIVITLSEHKDLLLPP